MAYPENLLDLKGNRLDYGQQLHPPRGFKLIQAVGATYTLDLNTLLSIPVALFHSKFLDEEFTQNRVELLDAIQKASDKLKVYCHKGQIKVPEHQAIFTFLEESIAEVFPNQKDGITSFHPKFWIIKFESESGIKLYRLIALSRNLTFDRSLDLAYKVEGFVSNKKKRENNNLVKYLSKLTEISDFEKSDQFLDELSKVNFSTPEDIKNQTFCPSGFQNEFANPLDTEMESDGSIDNTLLISPFVDITTIKKLKTKTSGKFYLFSREEELRKIDSEIFDEIEPYVVNNLIQEVDTFEEVQEQSPERDNYIGSIESQNLHAKLFIFEQKDLNRWFLGSSNATTAALERNHEFTVSLESRNENYSIENILENLISEDQEPSLFKRFIPLEEKEEEPEDKFRFEEYVNDLIEFLESSDSLQAKCTQSENDSYSIFIELKSDGLFKSSEIAIEFKPYGYAEGLQTIDYSGNTFKEIEKSNLSQFFVWNVKHVETGDNKSFLLKHDVLNLPDDRRQSIITKLLSDGTRFFRYISFLLGEEITDPRFMEPKNGKSKNNKTNRTLDLTEPLLEKLLIAAARNRKTLMEIDTLLEQIEGNSDHEKIKQFRKFWQPFKAFIKDE